MTAILRRSALAGLALLFAAALGAQSATDDALAFERSDSVALALSQTETHSLRLQHLGVRRGDGEEQVAPLQLGLGTSLEATVVDEQRGDGRSLRRRFEAARGRFGLGPLTETGEIDAPPIELASPLVGTAVAFVPREDQPLGWARHFDSVREAEEAELPLLEPPTDWGLLLPPPDGATPERGRRVGDAWDLDPRRLRAILAPVGHLALQSVEGEGDLDPRMLQAIRNGVGANLQVGFGGRVSGTAGAEVVEVEVGADDGDVVVIRTTFELAFAVDRTAALREGYVPAPGESDDGLVSASLGLSLQGTATVRWSLQLARPLTVQMDADETVEFVTETRDLERERVVQTLRFAGRVTTRATLRDVASTRDR